MSLHHPVKIRVLVISENKQWVEERIAEPTPASIETAVNNAAERIIQDMFKEHAI